MIESSAEHRDVAAMSKLLNRLKSMKSLRNLSTAQVPTSAAEYIITVL